MLNSVARIILILDRNQSISPNTSGSYEIGSELIRVSKNEKKKRIRTKPSRKPSFRPNFTPALRVLKRDIRRKYPEMFMNVINSHDINLFRQILNTFCLPSCETFDDNLQEDIYDYYHRPRYTKGIDALINCFTLSFQLFPDLITIYDNVQIHVKAGEPGSYMTGNIKLMGTQLFDMPVISREETITPNEEAISYVRPVDAPVQILPSSVSCEDLSKPQALMQLTRSNRIMEFMMEGKYCFQLDENHRFLSFRLKFQNFDCQFKANP